MTSVSKMPESIHKDDKDHFKQREKVQPNVANQDDDSDSELLFGALDDERSSSVDEGIDLRSTDAPLMENDRSFKSTNERKSMTKEQIVEQFIGMANFRARYRRSSSGLSVHWKDAAKKAGNLVDPWLDFKIDQYPEEMVIRHEYDPVKNIWNKKEITIKIEPTPFGNGSMRECFRVKKLETLSSNRDWDNASNCIAKRYISDVPHARYFDDVMMQMTTKLWAARYNQHRPPKKVDIIQMSVLEFKDRADRPFYHLEGFIEGSYIKYNSNSGFVCDDMLRHTPQAFSHFTFEASCHQLIVVDIQGVGDLYTDPQIHTYLGTEYGEGNLGIRGMSLFFFTHQCNPICSRLNLTPFDLSPMERERQLQQHLSSPAYTTSSSASTACRGSEEPLSYFSKYGSFFRSMRYQSLEDGSEGYASKISSLLSISSTSQVLNRSVSVPDPEQSSRTSPEETMPLSSSLTNIPEYTGTVEEPYQVSLSNINENNQRSSSTALERDPIQDHHEKQESILGQIHFDICQCHQAGRFSELGADEYDEASAFFHLKQAAALDIKGAVFALAKIYLDLPREVLTHYSPTDNMESSTIGVQLMMRATALQETEANLALAQLYDKGVAGSLEPDWKTATEYYEKYIHIRETETSNCDDNGETNEANTVSFNDQHDIVARLATLYMRGEYDLERNYRKAGDLFNKAAEMATAAMKGRLANKYYQAAEEAYALEPDDEAEDHD